MNGRDMEFQQGQKVSRIHIYGPADTDFDSSYCDMEIVMENGQMAGVPWVHVRFRESGEVVKVNCAKCACIVLAP